jgi:hypothetical protein
MYLPSDRVNEGNFISNAIFFEYSGPIIVGIENQLADMFELYPNPSSGLIQVDLMNDDSYNLCIYNSKGALVYEQKLQNHTETLDLQNLTGGLYLVKLINSKGQTSMKKIILAE